MRLGIDSFVPTAASVSPSDRIAQLLEEAEIADAAGVDTFGIGEHHRPDFLASTPATLLAAMAARTSRIRLSSAVTVLSSDDPVRVFQQFATVDLLSKGRAEIIVGRGSFIESYPLFGFDLSQYDELFTERLDLLLAIRDQEQVRWQGRTRAPLTGQGVYPRPERRLPVRIGVGGTPESFARAGRRGLPLTVAIIGGAPRRFRPLVDLYREEYLAAGHPESEMDIAVHSPGFLADSFEEAKAEHFPSWFEMFSRIGAERGWPPTTAAQYEREIASGSLYVGDPSFVADKVLALNEALGGIQGVSFLFGGASHPAMLKSIRLLGDKGKPLVERGLGAALPVGS